MLEPALLDVEAPSVKIEGVGQRSVDGDEVRAGLAGIAVAVRGQSSVIL